jgi:hypothetical protein
VGGDQSEAFQELKNHITRAPVLVLADDSKLFHMEANSSDVATGTVLSQQSDVDSKWHLIAYLSQSLSTVEQNYEIHNKEMLMIMRGLEDWRHFLEGMHHKVDVRGCPVNAPSRRPQMRSIRTMSLPDMTFATTHDFTQSVLSVSEK